MRRSDFDREVSTEEFEKAQAPRKAVGTYTGPAWLVDSVKNYQPIISKWEKDKEGKPTVTKILNQVRCIANPDNDFQLSYPARIHYAGPKNRTPMLCPKTKSQPCKVCVQASKIWAQAVDSNNDTLKEYAKSKFGKDLWIIWVKNPSIAETGEYANPLIFPVTAKTNIDTIFELLKNKEHQIVKSVTHTKNGYDLLFYKYTDSENSSMPKIQNLKLDDAPSPLHENDEFVEKMFEFIKTHPLHDKKMEDGTVYPGILKYMSDDEMMKLAFDSDGDDETAEDAEQSTATEGTVKLSIEQPSQSVKQEPTPEQVKQDVPPPSKITVDKMAEMKAKVAALNSAKK